MIAQFHNMNNISRTSSAVNVDQYFTKEEEEAREKKKEALEKREATLTKMIGIPLFGPFIIGLHDIYLDVFEFPNEPDLHEKRNLHKMAVRILHTSLLAGVIQSLFL